MSIRNINKQASGKSWLIMTAWVVCIITVLQSCKSDPNSPGFEYMPDMYRSPSYETYGENALMKDSMEALVPAKGSIPRGHIPYEYPATNEGYETAGRALSNPIPLTEEALAEGKEIFTKFCMHCHGEKGMGDGAIPTNSEYPPPPAYSGDQLKDLPVGKMYHTLMYGKGMMGSHASQLTREERWKVIHYVNTLQNPGGSSDEKDDNKDDKG